MRVLGIIPARGGSKGIPRKNMKLLNEVPLINYTINSAKESKLISKLVVSSDDDEIIAHSKSLGVLVPFKRPENLATDDSPTIDSIIHAIDFFESEGLYFDAVCLLQVTSPFRTANFIDEAISKFSRSKFDSLISVTKVPHHYNPHWVFEEKNGSLEISTKETNIITRRQDLPITYIRDGAIYLTKVHVLKERMSVLGENLGYIMSEQESFINIDTDEDWLKAERFLFKT